jgi:perosamine synthetase
MDSINASAYGVALLVDGSKVLRGVITDGDIRRAFLDGAQLDHPGVRYMRTNFVAGRAGASRSDNLAIMSREITHLPIVDDAGKLVDFISWKDSWRIPLVSPSFSGNEAAYIEDCLASGWVSSQGDYIPRFEEAVRGFVGSRHALATTNGTVALQLAIQALDIGFGDEVIVPDFTFGASASAVMQRGARPVFVDIDRTTWTLDPTKIIAAITPRTKAIMPVHIYGHPCEMTTILEIARRHRLYVIEDAAEALGAEVDGRKVGTLGDIGCFSFFANKIITTGEGGMVVTGDHALGERIKMLRDHGMTAERRYWHVEAGTNGRMTNLQAALGLAQMERIEQFLAHRDQLARCYDKELSSISGICPHGEANWGRKVCWLYSITVDADEHGMDRDALAMELKKRNIETRPVFLPLHGQPAYGSGADRSFPVTEWLAENGLSLPTGNNMPLIEAVHIAAAIRAVQAERKVLAGSKIS